MSHDPVLEIVALGFPWQTLDPFLFCVHHDDAYPAGNAAMGVDTKALEGRNLGNDFVVRDGFRMYHGEVVPGFPQHPHRGFETVTIARRGYIDHSDSLGAAARFGHGDVQWMTAGGGVVHSEMFPLVHADAPNPVELFQIWLNLPRASKLVPPHFAMLWSENVPKHRVVDAKGLETEVTVVAGQIGDAKAPPPPPSSWASHADADVAIWSIRMPAGATFTLPGGREGSNRMLYVFRGKSVKVAGHAIDRANVGVRLRADADVVIEAGDADVELLVLHGRPIGEPVVQYGPFVMNTPQEIQQAMMDYRRTGFGGWPWDRDDPVHARERGRFARHADGNVEER